MAAAGVNWDLANPRPEQETLLLHIFKLIYEATNENLVNVSAEKALLLIVLIKMQ